MCVRCEEVRRPVAECERASHASGVSREIMPAHFVKCEAASEERVTVSEANVATWLTALRNVVQPWKACKTV